MDCCNYVQPTYPGHFYQQQYFCYDNMNGGYGSYGTPQLSDAFDASTRYSRLPNAYPTDYVYNPKEARIRKAMREQSRDLSRQSVLPTSSSVSSSTGNNSSSNIATSGPVTNNYLNHPIPCASPASTGQVSSSSYNNTRNPWFQIGHNSSANHMKPSIISHRVMPTHQQRIFDKFSSSTNSCYTGDYTIGTTTQSSSVGSGESSSTTNGSVIVGGSSGGGGGGGGLESNDYCGIGEFTEGQKWHPYQNGPTSYHPRMGAMSKLPGRHGMTTNTPHSHNPWSQFCGLPLSSIAAQNGVIRGPRHMLFLQDQQERRCNFPDDISMPYMNNKMDIGHQLPNYSQANYQQDNEKRNEDSLKWENENNDNELRDKNDLLEKEKLKKKDDIKVYNDNNNDVKKIKLPLKSSLPSKQPLPGFHQAFGSTEIGRFSRSEYFANMVGDNGVSKNNSTTITTTTNINESLTNEQIDTDDNFNGLIINNNNNNNHTEVVELNTPKWHSPYVTLPMTGEI